MKRLSKRKKLLVRYGVLSLLALFLLVAGVLLSRPDSKPYRPGEDIEGITRSLDRDVPADYPRIVFKDVAEESGITFRHFPGVRSSQLPEDMGSGLAWGDYDGDGDPDLYLCDIARPLGATPSDTGEGSNRLYRNNGDGTFSDVTADAGVGYKGTSMGAAWADYDGDWHLDLVVTTYGGIVLYRNQGDGTFEDVSKRAGIEGFEGFWAGPSWGDFDGDDDLDLYVCGYVQYKFDPADLNKATSQYSALVPFTLNPSSYPPQKNLLFENRGNGSFREIAQKAGVENEKGRSLSATWADFNEDGKLDLYVANDISDNVMYLNQGGGKFEDISHSAWVADYRGAMGLGVSDWDNDGDLDIFVSHWLAQENALMNNLLYAFDHPQEKSEKLLFMDIADQNGLGQIALDYIGWATSFFDYNNDGLPDIFVINGSTFQETEDTTKLIPMRPLLFWNRGEENGFYEVGELSGEVFSVPRVGRGGAFADYDLDGDLDLAVINHGEGLSLLRNDGGSDKNWLSVALRLPGANHYGLGARVEVHTGSTRQLVQLGCQPSYMSQHAEVAHFGLGDGQNVERVIVTLLNGTRLVRENVSANQFLVIEQQ